MTPIEKYQQLVQSKKFSADPLQEKAVQLLQAIYDKLIPKLARHDKLLTRFRKTKPIKGLYLWGGVGVGKTWLMDIFYDSLPPKGKQRMHFHRFMRQIHLELKRLQGQKNPLTIIAKDFAKQHSILCFDEFFVSDITDAMLLAGLLAALFDHGITLVTTSNIAPDDLYKDGLQRDRFLPAIELIKKNTQVMPMITQQDYRMRNLEKAGIYYYPLNETSNNHMRQRFEELADTQWSQGELLEIEGRTIPSVRLGKGIVWFNFQTLCAIPRSQLDYLEIAKSFHTLFLSQVPKLSMQQTTEALYLVLLVDVLYDARVKLIISAECPIAELYQKGPLEFEFRRTKSRLEEMQSWEYLRKPHCY